MARSSQQNSLIEKYRYINVEFHDWWQDVYSGFTEDMKEVGIAVERMYFSGFYSQGDGACFVGCFDNTRTYLDKHHADQFPMIRKLLDHGGDVYATSTHTGHYYHSHSITIILEGDSLWQCIESKSELQDKIIEQWDELLTKEMSDLETAITDQWRAYMDELYDRLEKEYEYLTSDDAVWDTIEANELEEEVEEEEEDA